MRQKNISQMSLKPASNKGGRPRKHGAYSFLRTGIIPKGAEPLAQMADAAVTRMAQDLGGLENLSGNQIVILREIRQLMIYKFIVDERLMSDGIFRPGQALELQGPLNAFYLSCSNSITRNCGLLGLKKVSPAADDLQGYLQRQYGAGPGQGKVKESAKPLSKRTGGKLSPVLGYPGEVKNHGQTT